MTAPRHLAASAWAMDRLHRLARMPSRTAALAGAAMALPVGLLLAAVVLDVQPLGDALRSVLTDDGLQANALGRTYRLVGLLLLPAALALAAWPMLRRPAAGARRLHPLNLLVVAVVVVLMASTWGELAVEIVRCDVMGIPDCD